MNRNDAYKAFALSTRYGSKGNFALRHLVENLPDKGFKWDRAKYKYQKPNIPKASGFNSMNQLINTRNLLTRDTASVLNLETSDYIKIAPALSHLSGINMEYAFNNLPHLYLLLYQEYYYAEDEDIKESHVDQAFNKLITYNYFLKTKGLFYSLPSKLSKKQRILLNKLDIAFDEYGTNKGTVFIDEASSLSDRSIAALLNVDTLTDHINTYYTHTPQGIK